MHDLSQEDRDEIGRASQDWGIVGWVANGLLDHMLSASSCVSSHQCQQLLGERYLRISGELPRKLMVLDNTSETRVSDLRSYAFLWYEAALEPMQKLLQQLNSARDEFMGSAAVF